MFYRDAGLIGGQIERGC